MAHLREVLRAHRGLQAPGFPIRTMRDTAFDFQGLRRDADRILHYNLWWTGAYAQP